MPDMLNVVVLIVILGCAARGGYRCGISERAGGDTGAGVEKMSLRSADSAAEENPVYDWNDDDWEEVFTTGPAQPSENASEKRSAQPV
ncbi:MAG TPA: hypothetical protein VNZ55_12685 [Thermomicrobiales bacterium]|nr:hypothetical protein [Thermomicrobiales bacterium]